MSHVSSPPHSVGKRSAALLAAGLVVASLASVSAVSAHASTATLTSTPSTATAGGFVVLDAQGFTPGDALSFELDGVTLITSPVVGSTEAADANGDYTGDASIPDDAALGVHTVSVTDASGSATATTTITVVPQPTATVNPSSISLSDYLANGVTVTFSGFAPGETVGFGISDTASGIRISPDQTADANGEVTLHWVTRAGGAYAAPGTYEFRAASSDLSIVSQTGGFTVTADVAAVSPTTTSTTQTAPVATAAQAVARAVAFTG